MADDDYWFAPKRYGYGATPNTWQGWAMLAVFVLLITAVGLLIPRLGWWGYGSIVTILTVSFIAITAAKTKGGIRWRWGEDE